MQKKILGLGVVLLLALGLVMSACKDDAGGLPPEIWTGTVTVTKLSNYSSTQEAATLTLIGNTWTMEFPNLEGGQRNTGTYTNTLGVVTFVLSDGTPTIGYATIYGTTMTLFSVSYGGYSTSGTLRK